ncbi:MAG TPA: sulfite exporter TauE/SafE family protein [Pirellulales bacterium]|nr:sulfite exporter TauE/SafE family protein [Pirellulales bacterium]
MTTEELVLIGAVFFATSMISVVTGATSLITVPTLLLFGCEPRVAIATNMLALAFLSAGATIPFLRDGSIDRGRSPVLIALTVPSSALGAALVFAVPAETLPIIIGVMMIVIAGFVILHPHAGVNPGHAPSSAGVVTGHLATFLLGTYGGFFSGGYVTMLTAAWVALFRMPFRKAVGTTKLINTASSSTAVLVFAYRGTVDWRLGFFVSVVMFFGGIVGARVALRMNDVWLRRVFLSAVILLALKTIATEIPLTRMLQLMTSS